MTSEPVTLMMRVANGKVEPRASQSEPPAKRVTYIGPEDRPDRDRDVGHSALVLLRPPATKKPPGLEYPGAISPCGRFRRPKGALGGHHRLLAPSVGCRQPMRQTEFSSADVAGDIVPPPPRHLPRRYALSLRRAPSSVLERGIERGSKSLIHAAIGPKPMAVDFGPGSPRRPSANPAISRPGSRSSAGSSCTSATDAIMARNSAQDWAAARSVSSRDHLGRER